MFSVVWLLIGILAFAFNRAPGQVWRVLPEWVQVNLLSPLVQTLMAPLPVLASTVAVSLFAVWALGCSREGALAVCSAWFLVESCFLLELQWDVSTWFTPLYPGFLRHIWLVESLERLIFGGRFDRNDLVAAVFGTVLAYVIARDSIPARVFRETS